MQTIDKVQTSDSTTGTSTSTTYTYTYTTPPKYQSEKGWECPRCGRINAPWVRQCDCSRDNKQDITWNKDDYTKPWWYDYKVTCNGTTINADTFKIHPNEIVYTTAHNTTVGGSDYWDNIEKTWSNVLKHVSNIKEIY